MTTTAEAIHNLMRAHEQLIWQGRHGEVAEAIAASITASGQLVSRDEHAAKLAKAIDWQRHWCDRATKAENKVSQLQRALAARDPERLALVARDLDAVAQQRSARHDEGCWRRHTGCLARRILARLAGEDV